MNPATAQQTDLPAQGTTGTDQTNDNKQIADIPPVAPVIATSEPTPPANFQPSSYIPSPTSNDAFDPSQDKQSTMTNNPPPPSETTYTVPPPPAHNAWHSDAGGPHKKFPFMMVTFFLVLVLAGLAGSFLFFSYSNPSTKKAPAQILITPPVTEAPTAIPTETSANPFATTSSELVNPFATSSASSTNPFGTYQNPFTTATASSQSSQPYQNPFEKLK